MVIGRGCCSQVKREGNQLNTSRQARGEKKGRGAAAGGGGSREGGVLVSWSNSNNQPTNKTRRKRS
jgi:hypothetical protein